jgi:hypothetical protein
MSRLDSIKQRLLGEEKSTVVLQAKVKPSEKRRVEALVQRLNAGRGLKLTKSSLTRALVMEGVEQLEHELNESS